MKNKFLTIDMYFNFYLHDVYNNSLGLLNNFLLNLFVISLCSSSFKFKYKFEKTNFFRWVVVENI